MLDRALIREKLDWVHQQLQSKNFELDRKEFARLDEEERSLRLKWEDLRALRNRTSEEIAQEKKQGKGGGEKIEQMKEVSAQIKELDERVKTVQTQMQEFLSVIPNLPHESVPVGADESSNAVVREVGEPPDFDFEIDTERLEKAGLKTLPLPVPSLQYEEEEPLPASYANFYIANGKVLVPIFGVAEDAAALEALQTAFSDREVVGIDSRDLIRGLGAIHCITQQQPRSVGSI